MAELKLTIEDAIKKRNKMNKKINKAISNLKSCISVRAYEKDNDYVKEWESSILSEYKSIFTMSINYDILNSAIIKSNSETMITVCGRTMSVCEAIALKNSPANAHMNELHKKLNENYEKAIKSKGSPDEISEINIIFLRSVCKDIDDDEIKKRYRKSCGRRIIDPLKHEREKILNNYNNYEDKLEEAILKSNKDTVIVVNFID